MLYASTFKGELKKILREKKIKEMLLGPKRLICYRQYTPAELAYGGSCFSYDGNSPELARPRAARVQRI